MKKIVIVGAGPGGLTAAIKAIKAGYFVIVVEKKSENDLYKICAAGASRMDYIKYNIPPDIVALFEKSIVREFDHFRISTFWQSTIVKSDGKSAVTIDRKKLNELMVEKARELGVTFYFDEKVIAIEDNFVVTVSKDEQKHKYEFDIVIGADGSDSKIRQILELDNESEKRDVIQAIQYIVPVECSEIEFYLNKKFGNSYLWVFPWDNKTSIGTGKQLNDSNSIPTQKLRENLGNWIKKEISAEKFDEETFESAKILVDYKGFKFKVKDKDFFLVGDSGGAPNDFTGGGILASFAFALDVAEIIINPDYDCQRIKKILEAKKNSKKLLQFLTLPIIGRIMAEIFVFSLRFSYFRNKIGDALG